MARPRFLSTAANWSVGMTWVSVSASHIAAVELFVDPLHPVMPGRRRADEQAAPLLVWVATCIAALLALLLALVLRRHRRRTSTRDVAPAPAHRHVSHDERRRPPPSTIFVEEAAAGGLAGYSRPRSADNDRGESRCQDFRNRRARRSTPRIDSGSGRLQCAPNVKDLASAGESRPRLAGLTGRIPVRTTATVIATAERGEPPQNQLGNARTPVCTRTSRTSGNP
jgi:hypothetical protein